MAHVRFRRDMPSANDDPGPSDNTPPCQETHSSNISGISAVSCKTAIEQLFRELPSPEYDDMTGYLRQQEWYYINAFLRFLQQFKNENQNHDKECYVLQSIADHMISTSHPCGVRISFIEDIAFAFLDLPVIGTDLSAKARYLRYCKWIFQGRKGSGYYGSQPTVDLNKEAKEEGPVQIIDKRDFSRLPKALTVPSRCSFCSRPDIKLRCSNCVQKHWFCVTIATGYCDKICQELDWPRHKQICHDRKRFCRAVRLTRNLCRINEDMFTNLSLEGTHESDGIVYLTEGYRHLQAMRGDCFLRSFRRKHGRMDEEHVQMAHQDQFFTDLPIIMASDIFPWLWNDFCKSIEEFFIYVKNAHRPIVRFTVDHGVKSNMLRPHNVYRVTLKSGEVLAVDLTCSRFGWMEPVMRWDHYMQERVFRVIGSAPMKFIQLQDLKIPPYQPVIVRASIHRDLLNAMVRSSCSMLGPDGKGMPSNNYFLGLSDHEYAKINTEIQNIAWGFRYEKLQGGPSERKCKYRMYLNNRFEEWVEARETDQYQLEKVWMHQRFISRLEGVDREICKVFWRRRLRTQGVKFRDPPPSAEDMGLGATVFES